LNFLLDVTADALRANIGSKAAISLQRGPVDPKFQIEGVAPPTILLLFKYATLLVINTNLHHILHSGYLSLTH